eukprot:m.10614 g.10614  ORF g.10614 m.10614 type:complete len:256 (+) comp22489_c0_seq1:47-814(+)
MVQQQTTSPSEGPMIAAKLTGPGPAKYNLAGTCGYMYHDATKPRKPAFKIGIRSWPPMGQNSGPGPGAYSLPANIVRFGKDGYPSYSLYGRPKDLKAFQTPGPAVYQRGNFLPGHVPKAPSYSLGGRTRLLASQKTPAPNAYNIPTFLGPRGHNKESSPAYSIIGRSKTGSFHEDFKKTPGPGTYQVVDTSLFKVRSPVYSIAGRNMLPGDATVKPGPGRYSPEKVHGTSRSAPKFSFGVRHSEYTAPVLDVAID